MSRRTWGAGFVAGVLALLTSLILVPGAAADPLPASYAGSTHGDVLALDSTITGIHLGASLGHSATATDSNGAPRAHAESANLEANAVGIPVAVTSRTANSTPAAPTGVYNDGLGQINVSPVLNTGLLTGTGSTRWDGDATCVPDGTPIAQSTTSLAGATLGGIAGLSILDLGTVQTTGRTTLDAGSVVSSSAGNLADLTLINGLVQVHVLSQPTLTARSDGATGSVSANDYAVEVTALGTTTTLHAGGSRNISLNLAVADVSLTISVGQVGDTSSGATGAGSMTFLHVTGAVTLPLVGTNLANIDLGLLPLHASATSATGGVECDKLDAPVIQQPTNGATTGDSPAISGTGVPGAALTVTEGGTTVGTTTVESDGTWTLTPATPLSPGSHTILATQVLGGATSGPSSPVTFTVEDLTPPGAPVITAPADGSTTNDTTPAISGTAEPGSTVAVSEGGTELGTATADPDGTWSLTPSDPLAEGQHTITATATDAAGNTGPASGPDSFTVDTTAPAAPVITAPVDGSVTADSTPAITGTGEPGAQVTVTDTDGAVLGTTTVGTDGAWTLTPTTPLDDGVHTITATQTDPAGNTSTDSDPVTFTIDTTAPAAPVITAPADGSTTTDPTPPITGTGGAGDTVTVSIDGTDAGTTTVGTDGTWTFQPTTPLADGDHTVTATQTDPAGNTGPASAEVGFTVDATAPAAPVITAPADGSTTADSTPAITGTGEPGDTVTVTIDGTDAGTTTVGTDGTWTFTPTTPLSDGDHTVAATQTDPAGNTSPASDEVGFTVDTAAPAAPVITAPADGSVTADSTPAITGTGEPGAQVTVTDTDGAVLGTTTVGTDGAWTLTPTTALDEGVHTITATQTDPAGNTSTDSDPVTFKVDTTAPAAPEITTPADGSVTADSTPAIAGVGEPGATVTVTDDDGTELGTATVDSDSIWTLTPTTPLDDGVHTITATQTDPADNTSTDSDPVAFTVDTTAPAAPVITGPADGTTVGDSTPTITGTGEPGATVDVTIDGDDAGTATVAPGGTWTLTPSAPLADGAHTVTATQTDPAGNTSTDSDPVTFTVDTTAPAAPVIDRPANNSSTRDTTPTISGTGEPGATVTVTGSGGTTLGTAMVTPDGAWTMDSTPLSDGTYTITATQTDAGGNPSPDSSPVIFTVDTDAPAAPEITAPTDGSTVTDDTPTVTGTGEPGATVTVTVDGDVAGTTTVDGDGNWTFTPTAPLGDGDHNVTATQTDPAGNTSPASAEVGFTVDTSDTTSPAAPVITAPADGSSTTDRTPTITGTGEPGATVTVSIEGVQVGRATVGPKGNWHLKLDEPLKLGDHTVTATQKDAAGNVSPVATTSFTVRASDTSSGNGNCRGACAGDGTGSAGGGAADATPAASTPKDYSDDLPSTGASAALPWYAALGVLLLAAGTALALRRRRRP